MQANLWIFYFVIIVLCCALTINMNVLYMQILVL